MNLKSTKQLNFREANKISIIRLLLRSSNILLIQFRSYIKVHWIALFLRSITFAPSVLAHEISLNYQAHI